MIISHDRQTLFIGVPKNGSQTARSVLGQIGVDLVGEMGRHPTLPEAIRLAEEQFPGKSISPTAIYAFWRDPVERFCSAVEFHMRCLPNSLMQLFPDRFVGIKPHPRWFETNPAEVAADLRTLIESIPPLDILAALPPPPVPGGTRQPRGGNLSFYQSQSGWLDDPRMTVLAFADYENNLHKVAARFGWVGSKLEIPKLNSSVGPLPNLTDVEIEEVQKYYS